MFCSRKILLIASLSWLLSVATLTVFAQTTIKKVVKKERKPTFGVQCGKDISFNSLAAKPKGYATNKSVLIRQPLNQHLKIETGLNFRTCYNSGTGTTNNCSVPVTLQYYFLPDTKRLHPYCGAGIQGNLLKNQTTPPSMNTGNDGAEYLSKQADTKYITILFTQGVTFEVNTKIQVSQSLHFIPGNATKVIGIDFGVGYKFP